MALLVTGAAGFIGSQFVRSAADLGPIVVLDKLTYAGHPANLEGLNLELVQGDICDFNLVDQLFAKHKFSSVVHFAAESHVDNSISGPEAFVRTNVIGTFNLLEVSRKHWTQKSVAEKSAFRFVHVSTDEVFGALGETGKFSEDTAYAPNSPYSASKAGSDHLARAWFHTYGMPTITTNCSNNYGPRQFPEKLIPRMITNALTGKNLPVYGKGTNIRDWIHVEDHSQGVKLALTKGKPGETYCFGGNSERNNLDVVNSICAVLDELKPLASGSYKSRIEFVTDRAGHDFRYAIDDSKAQGELGFVRKFKNFEQGLNETVKWYLANDAWLATINNRASSSPSSGGANSSARLGKKA